MTYHFKDTDFIFEDDLEQNSPRLYEDGDNVIVNSETFTITELVKTREIQDEMGFPAIYSWYKAKLDEEEINLFFYDDDVDSVEKNNKIAEKWWEEAYRN